MSLYRLNNGLSNGGLTDTFSQGYYAAFQTLNADKISTFAIGDGAAQAVSTWGDQSYTNTASWDGDTRAPVTTNSYTSIATAGTTGTAPSWTTVDFNQDGASGETWDCSLPTDTSTIDFKVLFADQTAQDEFDSCNTQYDLGNNSWVDCNNAI